MTEEEIMFMSGKEEVKSEEEERVKSWRKIVLGGVMMMNRKRKIKWKQLAMGVSEESSSVESSSSRSDVSNIVSGVCRKGDSSAEMLKYAVELLLVGVK